jgi:adenosylcobinamide-phosphate synthase
LGLRALAVWATLGGRSLERAALTLGRHVARGELEPARALAPTLVGRDPSGLDGSELCRAALESLAENTSDAVVAPLLWAGVFGVAGATGYRAINTLDAMVGHRSERHLCFGWAAARLDDAANWPAARLSALLVVVLSPTIGGSVKEAWRAAFTGGALRHPSPNAGRVEGAFAGALGVRLGGVNRYPYGTERRPELGSGPDPGPDDIERGAALARRVGAAATVLAAALAWGRTR